MPNRNNGQINCLLFLAGLFSVTQVYVAGYISVCELVMNLIAPFVFFKTLNSLRRERIHMFLLLVVLAMVGCVVAAVKNHVVMPAFLRGFFTLYSVWAAVICLHALLRQNFDGLKWFLIGVFLSGIISIFVFQTGSSRVVGDTEMISASAMERTIGGALFWTRMLTGAMFLLISCFYDRFSKFWSVTLSFGCAFVSFFGSGVSGRSVALCSLGTAGLLLVGNNNRKGIEYLRKHSLFVIMMLILVALSFKSVYKALAVSGVLGDEAVTKYEQQTQHGSGVLGLLMGGRIDFFATGYACLRKPIVGYGPWPIDYDGLYEEFILNYGTENEIGTFYLLQRAHGQTTNSGRLISHHSCILGGWLWYGIGGLVLWIYVLYLAFNAQFRWMFSYPKWFGYIACTVPLLAWNIFFSPFGGRPIFAMQIVCFLLLRACTYGWIPPGGTRLK